MKEVVLKYALQNAVKYNGKANVNAVIGHILAEKPELKAEKRFFKEVAEIVKKVNLMNLEEQKTELKKLAPKLLRKKLVKKKILPELKNVKKKVVMRLAPYPSGPLHIGNAKSIILNDYYVKKYKGKLLLIIDDTIGSREKFIAKDAYKLIPESLKWLGIKFDKKIIYKSDRLRIYYRYAEQLIKKAKAYVCFCSAEKLRENRAKKIECSCRKNSIEKNLKFWKEMLKNKYKEGKAILRIKTSMQHKNPAFRDRVLFRISKRAHPRIGKKYSVWPLLEFSWAVDDHLLGITHVLRGKDLMMESEMEKFIWDIFGWKKPELIHIGILQIEGFKISKSKSAKEVSTGQYIGWDDPRTWSLQALKRRGIQPEAIRNFCLETGLTMIDVTVPIESLYAKNKKIIEARSNRYFFVEDPKKIKIKNAPKLTVKVPLHPDFKKRGNRILKTSDEFFVQDKIEKNKNYRFMHLFNFKNNEFVSKELDEKLKAKLIHWLPVSKDLVKVEILMDDGSLKKGLGEAALKNVKVDEVIQFERFAFCKVDKKEKNKVLFWFTHQ